MATTHFIIFGEPRPAPTHGSADPAPRRHPRRIAFLSFDFTNLCCGPRRAVISGAAYGEAGTGASAPGLQAAEES